MSDIEIAWLVIRVTLKPGIFWPVLRNTYIQRLRSMARFSLKVKSSNELQGVPLKACAIGELFEIFDA
jgi:hypothetical protein